MAEVENLCDRIAILSGGRIAFIGTVEQLGETVGKHYNITIQTETGTGKYESDNIGETLLTLLVQCREKGETIKGKGSGNIQDNAHNKQVDKRRDIGQCNTQI